jgi:hypothetical protein
MKGAVLKYRWRRTIQNVPHISAVTIPILSQAVRAMPAYTGSGCVGRESAGRESEELGELY